MNVKRIVVDELPNSCSKCNLYLGVDAFNSCMVVRKPPYKPYETRASWCPLEVEEVCGNETFRNTFKEKYIDGSIDMSVESE